MSASAGSGLVRTTTTAAAVVLKRTAPERQAAVVATPTPRRRGPAAPARRHLGPGRGCAGSRIAGPCSWPLRGWARSPPPEPARLHSGRRLLPHPLQHVVYPVILDHHCAGRKRISRAVSGGGGDSGAGVLTARADLLYCLCSRDTTGNPMHPHPNSPADPTCYQTRDPNLPIWEHPSSEDSQCEPSRHLSLPPSKLTRNLSLRHNPLLELGSDEAVTWCNPFLYLNPCSESAAQSPLPRQTRRPNPWPRCPPVTSTYSC